MRIRTSIRARVAAGAFAAAMVLSTPGAALAAHCTDSGGPGNSDFATHVQENHNGHNEGIHQGWSSCVPQAKSGGR